MLTLSTGIGCAGELEIRNSEKYEDWELIIKVKFRDHEKLQQLTRHRQSGGVRWRTPFWGNFVNDPVL
jgi:hypothetical protein